MPIFLAMLVPKRKGHQQNTYIVGVFDMLEVFRWWNILFISHTWYLECFFRVSRFADAVPSLVFSRSTFSNCKYERKCQHDNQTFLDPGDLCT